MINKKHLILISLMSLGLFCSATVTAEIGFPSSNGKLIIPPLDTPISLAPGQFIVNNGSLPPKWILPDAIWSHYSYSGSAPEIWGGFQGPSPFDKLHGYCTSFNLTDNQTNPLPPSNDNQQNGSENQQNTYPISGPDYSNYNPFTAHSPTCNDFCLPQGNPYAPPSGLMKFWPI